MSKPYNRFFFTSFIFDKTCMGTSKTEAKKNTLGIYYFKTNLSLWSNVENTFSLIFCFCPKKTIRANDRRNK